MGKLYQLEAYHFDKDYWSTIGQFISKDDAEKVQKKLEMQHPFLLFNIFSKEIYDTFEEFCSMIANP